MSEWETVRVSDVAEVRGGATPSTKITEYWNGLVPWLTPKDLSERPARYTAKGSRNITQLGLDKTSATLLPKGSVLMTSRAPIGLVTIASHPIATNQGFKSLIFDDSQVPEFWYYLLGHSSDYLYSVSNGSTFKEVSGKVVRGLEFRVPPLPEQRRIAGVLGALDDLIDTNERLARNLDTFAIAQVEQVTSTVSLSSIAQIASTKAIKPQGLVAHYSLPAYDSSQAPEVVDGQSIKSNKYPIDEPSVLISRLNPRIQRIWLVYPSHDVPNLASTEFMRLQASDATPVELLYAATSGKFFVDEIVSRVTGTTGSHQRIDKKSLMSIQVPDIARLCDSRSRAVVAALRSVHELRLSTVALRRTRDELLPLLMSGKIRVREAEEVVQGVVG